MLHDLHECPCRGRERGVRTCDEGERIEERLGERREVKAACALAADCRAGDDGVTNATACKADGRFDAFDLDHGA